MSVSRVNSLSEPQFSCVKNGDKNCPYVAGLLGEFSEMVCAQSLAPQSLQNAALILAQLQLGAKHCAGTGRRMRQARLRPHGSPGVLETRQKSKGI